MNSRNKGKTGEAKLDARTPLLDACQRLLHVFESMDGEAGGVCMTDEDANMLRNAIKESNAIANKKVQLQ